MKSKLLFHDMSLCHTFSLTRIHVEARFRRMELMTGYRIVLCASILGAGLLCSLSINAAPRASQDNNSNSSATAKPVRKKVKRSRVRTQRQTAMNSKANTSQSVPQTMPQAATPADALKKPPVVYADPVLLPSEQRINRGAGDGIGTGPNSGGGGGMGGGTGSGVVDYNRTFNPRMLTAGRASSRSQKRQ